MKPSHLLLVLIGLLGQRARGQTTAWRLFRPGFVYSFASVGGTATAALHTLRVDSMYATAGGDSVYTFNRLLRLVNGSNYQYRKSRNNLLGARLRWQPGTLDYYLEANAEPAIDGATMPTTLLLRPRAAVGSTWLASTQPALTATLSSRSYGQVGTLPDSLTTITLSNGQQFMVSKHYGLVLGPQWLTLTGSSPGWQQRAAPQAGLGDFNPQTLFALSVGDELGYEIINRVFASSYFICSQGYQLRRITSRQLTADSLLLSFQQQMRTTISTYPGCGTPGTTTSPVSTGRWAIALRTGRSPQFPYLNLLTGEYRTEAGSLFMGRNVAVQPGTSDCQSSIRTTAIVPMYLLPGQPLTYYSGLDNAARLYEFSSSLGIGPITLGSSPNFSYSLTYYKRNGTTCGTLADFATLLPTRAALAAQVATLHPNPASPTEPATLTLAAPAPAGATLTLTDALGRQLWSHPVASGQKVLSVPVATAANCPAGFYLVHLSLPSQPPLTFRLTTTAN